MTNKILLFIFLTTTGIILAQEGTSSPYSAFGIGLQKFKGTVENRSMGGLSILSDSIHLNLQNPASYGDLKLTAYSLGASYNISKQEDNSSESTIRDGSLDYVAVGIPAGKFSFGFGLIPYTSVGYDIVSQDTETLQTRTSGSGGLNKVFLATGVNINGALKVGIDFTYNFGNIENKVIQQNSENQFNTREINNSNLSGFRFSIGVQYKQMIADKLELSASIVSTPSFELSSDNSSELASILLSNTGQEIVLQNQEFDIEDSKADLPAEFRVGIGIGQPKKWYIGGEYVYIDSNDFMIRSNQISLIEASPENTYQYRLGGYYIPKYNSLTNLFNKIVYRGGLRYEKLGLNVNNKSINEFGISFGVGVPIGSLFSNANIGFEFGRRGTTDFGLVREDFLNISIGLSLNDQWFRQLKFN